MDEPKQKSWIGRLTEKIRQKIRPETPAPVATSASGAVNATLGNMSLPFFKVSTERDEVYNDVVEMEETIDEVATALDVLADNSVNAEDGQQGAFRVVFTKGDDTIAQETIKQTRWQEKAFPIARDTLLYGDTFLQYVVDSNLKIVRLMDMPPATMVRNEDQFGLLMNGTAVGEAAFEQYSPGTTQRIAWWYPWQIEHIRWSRSGKRPYGRSLLYTARTAWKKWQAMEEALVINWLTRAFARLLFILDVTGKSEKEAQVYITKFADSLTTRRVSSGVKGEEELSVVKDIYMGRSMHDIGGRAYPGQTDVRVLDTSNTSYLNLRAIEYYQNKVLTSLRVPKAHLGLERDINAKATLTQQDRRFIRVIRRIQSMLSEAIAHTIVIQYVLYDTDPTGLEFSILWPTPSWMELLDESSAVKNFAVADKEFLNQGIIDKEYIQTRHLRMSRTEIERINVGGTPS